MYTISEQTKKTILVAEDNLLNRELLVHLLESDYTVLQATNGQQAWDLLIQYRRNIKCIILDLIMPIMDGFEFLIQMEADQDFASIPVVVATGSRDSETEEKVLELGAWDFITKPYSSKIIRFRIRNAIMRSQLAAFERLTYLAEYDTLTGLYNKAKFLIETRKMLDDPQVTGNFALVRFDIDRFQLINNFYGNTEGDRLLRFIASYMNKKATNDPYYECGRIHADIFVVCLTYETQRSLQMRILAMQEYIKTYNRDIDIVLSYGVYLIEDTTLPVSEMFDKATIAAKACKGNYINSISFYSREMSSQLEHEQSIVNEMNSALAENQFCFYLQPKYTLTTDTVCGSEALVRWVHPERGLIPPSDFVPIFERNGFIARLDYYLWEEVCKYLKREINAGRTPFPISVNVSRVNMYNPRIVDIISSLVNRYKLPPHLLQLEITESAYMDRPEIMQKVISELQSKNFKILMDDFGSGYSSLSLLKDICVDILKIDMHFFEESKIAGRGENIVASIVRMAKLLHIPVIAEGVEKSAQVEFLRSIGCEYIQGYYFARPMPIADYDTLILNSKFSQTTDQSVPDFSDITTINQLWSTTSDMDSFFANTMQPTCTFAYDGKRIEILRVNKAYIDLFGPGYKIVYSNPYDMVFETDLYLIETALENSLKTHKPQDCEFRYYTENNTVMWLHLKTQFISSIAKQHIFSGSFMDISSYKQLEDKLHKLEQTQEPMPKAKSKLLIIDTARDTISNITLLFAARYTIICASDTKQGIETLEKEKDKIALIITDIRLPELNMKQFLAAKNKMQETKDIPIVIISDETAEETQVQMIKNGVSDYITKPFITEVLQKRICNVLGKHL